MLARSAVSKITSRLASSAAAFSRRDASTLVLAEAADGGKLSNSSLSAITAASKLGGPITVLAPPSVAKAASSVEGVSKVLTCEDKALEHDVAENVAALVSQVQAAHKFSHIVAVASNSGKNIVPRLAVKLDAAPISDVTAIKGEDTFERPMYAGNAIATVKSSDSVKIMTIRPTAFDKAKAGSGAAPVESFKPSAPVDAGKASFLSEEKVKSERPELASAPIVVSGGRALGSADNFKILYALADKMGAAVGASRAAVDAGYVSNDLQVGQTGKVVAPGLYVAVGISGAIQHLAGMKDSKTIVAINKDAEAPIMQVADYGLVEDLFKAVPELTSKVPAK